MPSPFFGFRMAGLTQDTYLEAFKIHRDKVGLTNNILSEERMEQIQDIRGTCESDTHLLERLANSICPEIYGMTEVK